MKINLLGFVYIYIKKEYLYKSKTMKHIKLFENSSSAGRSFGYNYGNIANVPGNLIGQNMLAQDSNGTSGVITTNAVGSVSNTTGATKYFIFVGAQQDISTGNFYVNRWNENESYIEAWEVA